jgi:hypothetical protein
MVTPTIYFSYNHFREPEWIDLTAKQIAKKTNDLHIAVKAATEYSWDNTHFVLADSSGLPALKLQWDDDGNLSVWSARTNCTIGEISAEAWDSCNVENKTPTRLLQDWADNAVKGMARCSECGRWVNAFKHYGYTGSVCLECYDPKKHKQPNTSGD